MADRDCTNRGARPKDPPSTADFLHTLRTVKAAGWSPEGAEAQRRMIEFARTLNPEMADMLTAYFAPYRQ